MIIVEFLNGGKDIALEGVRHCGPDPQSTAERQRGRRIGSGMTTNGPPHGEIVYVDKALIN